MTQRPKAHGERTEYASQFWLEHGLGPGPSTREKFVALTIDELARTGPYSFNATLICDLLGTTYPMVNHYFGSRDGLVAEAVVTEYRKYVFSMRDAAESASTPESRLEAWILREMEWTIDHPGIAVVINFPHASLEVSSLMMANYAVEMNELFEFNMAIVMQLVLDIQHQTVTPITFKPGALPREEFMSNRDLVRRASSIGLSTLGMSIWASGQHAPGSRTVETRQWMDDVAAFHIAELVALSARGA